MKRLIIFCLMACTGLYACKDAKKSGEVPQSQLAVRLTDAPGNYEEVNIDIQRVEVNYNVESENPGLVTLNVRPGIYNLVRLTNGLDTLLADATVPPGTIHQIRLILGPNNTVKEFGQAPVSLSVPSGMQSGIKVNFSNTLEPGSNNVILLDWDAERSVVKAGNSGIYNLKPVIRAVAVNNAGSIAGRVTPEGRYYVMAVDANRDTASTYSQWDGRFRLVGLKAGTYTVTATATDSTATTHVVEGVSLTNGQQFTMGDINF